ncbi:stealth family protein [Clavibacter michiganensis]|uniref:Sugar phosphotransferase n=2 Tax=Clavibacter TaxID=1573 RepID=A0A0D5CHX6_9MICO|nr:stealth family protein [Clavibacter michiganensis]AJW79216.1 sugar phosphotransferase [Clavibacter michiganensis subsp. insidiosus]AWF98065.1 sugar phosphotransferase [Clavibacter michiganensis subsp. insidiosus]AWG01735.1 sugar phosphotransferase [Clavibacter michiganensis subsp. insidiosus]OQJ59750.1 sugar phosphotransferase [Clavibacter michiganensis subsp. insidiosus]RII85858.1 sugar phosphotransferase [Clavibacter michiganensis subsp. insidiosus]
MAGSARQFNVALEPTVDPATSEEEYSRQDDAVAPAPATWPTTHHRPDVVVRKGLATLVNRTLTPHQALVTDLLFIRDALLATGIDFWLIRGNDERPVIAIDVQNRDTVVRALVAACADEPLYAKTVDGRRRPPLLVADGRLTDNPDAGIFRLYRPRIEPVGLLAYGASTAVELQFFRFEGETIVWPVENSLTREILPAAEVVPTTVEMYGHEWKTLRGMFDAQASDITFDIDMVFSWVDGNDPEFQKRRAERMKDVVVGEGDDSEARFRQIDELKYALRSVYLFAPWVRRIFIVTDSPKPSWLADHPAVTFVRSEEFFTDPAALPTHNSQAVESQLQHIPGLSEHFLYSNDDMFFGRPVQPGMFFSPGGITKFIEAATRIGLGDNDSDRSGFENSARVNRRLLMERFGRLITRHLEHAATPLRKSVLLELEQEFAEDFHRTQLSRFRSSTDISVTNSLYHYYAQMTARAVQQENAKVAYVDTTSRAGLDMLPGLLKRRSQDFFCLNDGSFPEVPADERQARVQDFLERYYGIPAPWEAEVADAAGAPSAGAPDASAAPAPPAE